jgi:Leucine-rich repeat (LRR) protein
MSEEEITHLDFYNQLDRYNQKFTVLPNLKKYKNLLILNCPNNKLTILPELPNTLIKLYCWFNQLTTLPKLPDTLIRLNCFNNLLTTLPKLPDTLKHINCSYNPQLLNIYLSYDLDDIRKIQKFKLIYYQRKIHKSIINFIKRYRFKKIQEELIIKTWHPNRFFDWCLSIDDK